VISFRAFGKRYRSLGGSPYALPPEFRATMSVREDETGIFSAAIEENGRDVKGKVLLFDNDTGVLEGMRALLEHTGLEVYTTSSLLDFHALVARHEPDLVLVDINIATLKGDEIVAAARHRLNASTVVLFSGISRLRLAELTHASGADGFLSKMDDSDEILKQVVSWVEQRQRLRGDA
jgi:DNA-binding NtrC family response regulator